MPVSRTMLVFLWLTLLSAVSATAQTADESAAPTGISSLVAVHGRRFERLWLQPSADLRPYSNVMLDPVEVAFSRRWLSLANETTPELSRKVSEADVRRMLGRARADADASFRRAFAKAGYAVVDQPGPGILRVHPRIHDLDLTAPAVMTAGPSRSWASESGAATIELQLSDSATGALIARATDHQRAGPVARQFLPVDDETNAGDLAVLYDRWADASVTTIEGLKKASPYTLEPGTATAAAFPRPH